MSFSLDDDAAAAAVATAGAGAGGGRPGLWESGGEKVGVGRRDGSTPHVPSYKSTVPNKLWMIYSFHTFDIFLSLVQIHIRVSAASNCNTKCWKYADVLALFSFTNPQRYQCHIFNLKKRGLFFPSLALSLPLVNCHFQKISIVFWRSKYI